MLELGLEQPGHLDRGPGRAGDRDRGVLVGLEDLLDPPVRDLVALRRLAVAGDHHAVRVPQGEDRRPGRDAERARQLAGAVPRLRRHRRPPRADRHDRWAESAQPAGDSGRQSLRRARLDPAADARTAEPGELRHFAKGRRAPLGRGRAALFSRGDS